MDAVDHFVVAGVVVAVEGGEDFAGAFEDGADIAGVADADIGGVVEALVDAASRKLHSLRTEAERDGKVVPVAEFTVLAINVEPEQRSLVGKVMTALGVGFVPLQSDWQWAEHSFIANGKDMAECAEQYDLCVNAP